MSAYAFVCRYQPSALFNNTSHYNVVIVMSSFDRVCRVFGTTKFNESDPVRSETIVRCTGKRFISQCYENGFKIAKFAQTVRRRAEVPKLSGTWRRPCEGKENLLFSYFIYTSVVRSNDRCISQCFLRIIIICIHCCSNILLLLYLARKMLCQHKH